jgi:hypothetical protein
VSGFSSCSLSARNIGSIIVLVSYRALTRRRAKLETNRPSQGATETSHLLRSEGRRSSQRLHRPTDPSSIWTKFLIPIAVAALPAGCLFFGASDPPVNVVVPQLTTNGLSAEFLPLQQAKVPLSKATDITIESRIEPEVTHSTVESPIEPKVQTALFQLTAPLDIKPTEPTHKRKGSRLRRARMLLLAFPQLRLCDELPGRTAVMDLKSAWP